MAASYHVFQFYTQEVNDLINKAYAREIYVIGDWHILNPGDPNYNLSRAKTFFTDVIKANAGKNNLIYEIANEPNGVSWATMASKKIGWINWNFADDFRSGSIWKTNTCSSGAWVDSNLKPSGVYIKNKIQTP